MSAFSKAWKATNWKQVGLNTIYLYSTCYCINQHLGELIICKGTSMMPTMHDGDVVVAEKLSIKRHNIWKNDIICATDPYNHRGLICKRVANGPLDELDIDQKYEFPLRRVPPGHCFLLGDHQEVSSDSRIFGPVPLGLIQARLVLRIWPLSRFGWVSTHSYKDETYKIS
ncbi:Signal peptidase I [Aphelenchoides bicaudatus]|nr:Signal peptidase I [Aphelenchoides bicaudatus]